MTFPVAKGATTSFSAEYIDDIFGAAFPGPVTNPLLNQLGVPLTAGTDAAGDGTILQLGYFTSLANPSAFDLTDWETFVPITSATGTRFTTTIGDPGAPGLDLTGIFTLSLDFTDLLDGGYLPTDGLYTAGVRFYNGTMLDLTDSTHFNIVSSDDSNWVFPGLSDNAPIPNDQMSLDNDSIIWQSELAGSGTGTFATSIPIPAGAGTVVWQNTGTDWTPTARWDNSGGGSTPPGPADIAAFPDAAVITQPDLDGTNQNVLGMTIDNTSGVYTFSDSVGTGSLTIGASGIVASGGGVSTLDLDLVLGADQTWDIDTNTTVSYSDATNTLNFGNFTLTKAGAGTLVLNEDSYTNIGAGIDVDVTAGTLVLASDPGANFMVQLGDGTMLSVLSTTLDIERKAGGTSNIVVNGTLNGTISGDGEAVFRKAGTGTATINSLISGAGGIEINDPNAGDTIILTADNTYSGTTTVTAGILLIDGDQSSASGAVSVAASAQLGGSGIVGGATTMAAGSELAPGADGTTGTLSFANGLDSSGSTWLIDITSPLDLDVVDVTGNLDITGATLTLSGAPSAGTPHIIASYSGTLTGTFAFDNVPAGWTIDYAFGAGSNQIALIPEPGTVLPLAAILTPWIMRRRRRS